MTFQTFMGIQPLCAEVFLEKGFMDYTGPAGVAGGVVAPPTGGLVDIHYGGIFTNAVVA
jgi:hypothetical protein